MSDPSLFAYTLVGGSLEMPKRVLVQDLLSSDSLLRRLFALSPGQAVPGVEPAEGGRVTLRFDQKSSQSMNEAPRDLLERLAQKYPGTITGKVRIRSVYTTFAVSYLYDVTVAADGLVIESAPI